MVEIEFSRPHPELAGQFARGEAILACSLALRAIEQGQFRDALELITKLSRSSLQTGTASLIWLLAGLTRRVLRWGQTGARTQSSKFLSVSTHRNEQTRCGRSSN
jgi:hypothetical protein